MTRPVRICFVCTHSFTLATLYKGLFPYLRAHGYEIEVIVGDREYTEFDPTFFGDIRPHVIPMQRMPHPGRDAMALERFMRFFLRHRFDVVHVSTPKAALLGSIAAKLTRNGKVAFVHRRLVYQMMSGWRRNLFRWNDQITCAFSDLVVPVSRQIRDELVDGGLVSVRKVRLIGSGASNGTNVARFNPDAVAPGAVTRLRAELRIPEGAPVLLYLSRVGREKGVDLLPDVLDRVRRDHPAAVLVVAGPEDEREPPSDTTRTRFADDPHIRRIGFISDPSPFYALADLFLFPSYFEGIANALLEAAAHERPAIGFRVPGVEESIADQVSGILVPSGNAAAMAVAASALLGDEGRRRRMGQDARKRVVAEFSNEVVWRGLDRTLRELIAS